MFRTELLSALLFSCLLAGDASAQRLRHGVLAGELVVVARVESATPHGDGAILHRLRPIRTLKGEAPELLTVVEYLGISCRPYPVPGAPRIYCLNPSKPAELPQVFGPYFQMTGFLGDHPVVELEPEGVDPYLRLARLLVERENGGSPSPLAASFLDLALTANGPARTEAVDVLRADPVLRESIAPARRSELLARAVAERTDLVYKNALASLCAELRMSGVVDALCSSLERSPESGVPRTIGRLARFLHGEEAALVLQPHLLRARRAGAREQLLLAIGATETRGGLELLLKERRDRGPSRAIDSALRVHGSPVAMKAVRKKD